MSDISFLLLTFFLLTSSINTEQGIPRKLPPPKTDDTEEIKADINKRNVLNVIVNFRDEIYVNGEVMMVSELKDKAKIFFSNPTNDPSLPVKRINSSTVSATSLYLRALFHLPTTRVPVIICMCKFKTNSNVPLTNFATKLLSSSSAKSSAHWILLHNAQLQLLSL